jgi:hypothetical protein
MVDVVSVHYSRDVGWSGALIVEVCRTAPSTVLLTFNYDQRPEIGVYQASLGEGAFQQTLDVLRESGYALLAPPGPFQPESKFVVIGERVGVDVAPKLHAFDLRTFPAALDPVRARLERVAEEIRQHRSRVLQGTAAWSKATFDTDEPLAARVSLKNAGVLPLTVANPASAGREGGFRLVLRSAGGLAASVDIDGMHLRPSSAGAQGGLGTLAPGDALAFDLRKTVYLPPGSYMGWLAYRSLVDVPGDPQFIEGELWLELGAMRVETSRAP